MAEAPSGSERGDSADSHAETAFLRDRLAQAEQRQAILMSVLDAVGDTVYRLNVKSNRYDYVSAACRRATGLSESEILSHDRDWVRSRVHPDDIDRLEAVTRRLSDAGRSGASEIVEYRFLHGDGSYHWFHEARSVVVDDQGDVEAIVGAVQDVTDAKKTQRSLAQSENRMQVISETLKSDLFWTAELGGVDALFELWRQTPLRDPDEVAQRVSWQWQYVSEGARTMFGMSPEDVLERTLADLLPPDGFDQAIRALTDALDREFQGQRGADTDIEQELRLLPRHGEPFWAEVKTHFVYDERNLPSGVIGISRSIAQRKRIHEALTSERETLNRIIDLNPYAIGVTDGEGRPVRANRALNDLFGAPPPEGYRLFEDPVLIRAGYGERLQALRRGETIRLDDVVFNPSTCDPSLPDRDIHLRVVLFPILDDLGRLDNVVLMHEDITAHKQALQALSLSEQRYRTLVDNLPVGLLRTRPDAKAPIMLANPAAARMLGYDSPEALTKLSPGELYPDPGVREERLAGLRPGGPPVEKECQFRRRDGRTIWVALQSILGEDADGQEVIDTVISDITLQKRTLEQLAQSERRYRGLVESQDDLIVRVDPEGRFTFVNDGYCRKFGLTREQLLGTQFMPRVHPDDLPGTLEAMKGLAFPPYRVRMEQRAMTVNGWRWLEWEDYAIRDDAGQTLEIQAIGRDITERRLAERDAQRAHHQLITAREEERRRLARELHDSVGQSLVALQMTIQTALSTGLGHADARSAELMGEASVKCGNLIGEVRTLSHGLYPPALESLGLVSALRSLGRNLHAATPITLDFPPELEHGRLRPEVEIVLFRIAQEAVANALRHSGAGRIALELDASNDQVALTVVDDGAGFDPARARGKGLGLTNMRERAHALGGSLTIASRPGRTEVSVRVPREPEPAAPLA